MFEEILNEIRRARGSALSAITAAVCGDDFNSAPFDLARLYKLPMMFVMSDQYDLANSILDQIKIRFQNDNGDFISHDDVKKL